MAFIQGGGIQSVGSVASVSKAFNSPVTAGNAIIVAAVCSATTTWTAAMVSDTLGNTYTARANGNNTTGGTRTMIASTFGSSGGSCTVTIDLTGSDFQTIGIAEVSLTSAAFDVGNNAAGSGGSQPSVSITTTGNDDIIFGLVSHEAGGTVSITENGAYTVIFEDENTANMPISWVYRIASAGTYAVSWTTNPVVIWNCLAASFKTNTVVAPEPPPIYPDYSQFPKYPLRRSF